MSSGRKPSRHRQDGNPEPHHVMETRSISKGRDTAGRKGLPGARALAFVGQRGSGSDTHMAVAREAFLLDQGADNALIVSIRSERFKDCETFLEHIHSQLCDQVAQSDRDRIAYIVTSRYTRILTTLGLSVLITFGIIFIPNMQPQLSVVSAIIAVLALLILIGIWLFSQRQTGFAKYKRQSKKRFPNTSWSTNADVTLPCGSIKAEIHRRFSPDLTLDRNYVIKDLLHLVGKIQPPVIIEISRYDQCFCSNEMAQSSLEVLHSIVKKSDDILLQVSTSLEVAVPPHFHQIDMEPPTFDNASELLRVLGRQHTIPGCNLMLYCVSSGDPHKLVTTAHEFMHIGSPQSESYAPAITEFLKQRAEVRLNYLLESSTYAELDPDEAAEIYSWVHSTLDAFPDLDTFARYAESPTIWTHDASKLASAIYFYSTLAYICNISDDGTPSDRLAENLRQIPDRIEKDPLLAWLDLNRCRDDYNLPTYDFRTWRMT